MAELRVDGVGFNVVRLGTPTSENLTVVMLHGLVMDNLSSFYYTLANPLALNHEVVLYDQRGHGRSERPASGYRLADSVADLGGILDALNTTEPVVLVGNSYGGTIAVEFALRHPERVAGLVLIEAHVSVEGWGDHMAGSLAFAAFGLDDTQVKDWLATQGGRKLNRLARNAEALIYDTSLLDDLAAVPSTSEEDLAGRGLSNGACQQRSCGFWTSSPTPC
jgi:pimeloyl-ACP methyl ester carboxylesterase